MRFKLLLFFLSKLKAAQQRMLSFQSALLVDHIAKYLLFQSARVFLIFCERESNPGAFKTENFCNYKEKEGCFEKWKEESKYGTFSIYVKFLALNVLLVRNTSHVCQQLFPE